MKHDNDNDNGLRFLSVCSGIEAASVAWPNWKCVAFSEIEKFPSAVLMHHYPDVPNLGDFTKIDVATLGRVDIFCGGTPCQAFSVAGLRNSLADARGNLSLEFVRLAHELADGNGLRNVAWENVPGVLNTKDNAFGCFLGGLVGADDAVPPPHGSKWPDAGMVSGPRGRAAWRILDAQFFGLAQRRKRVIVVADFGNGADPAAVLFERVGMQGNSAPSREKREGVAPTISARTKGGGGLGTDFDLDGGLIEAVASVGNRCSGPIDIAPAVNAHGGPHGRQDFESEAFLVHAIQAGALRTNPNSGPDGVGVQADIAYTLEARAEVQAVSQQVYSIMPQNSGKDYKARPVEVAQPVMAAGQTHGNQGGDVVCVTGTVTHTLKAEGADASEDGTGRGTPIIAFDPRQTDVLVHGDITGPLDTGQPGPAICFTAKDYGADAQEDIAPTLRAGTHDKSHANGGVTPAVTVNVLSDVHTTLCARPAGPGSQDWQTHAAVYHTSAVRRLTPMECERLQGFPDGYTDIPWRGKPNSPDGPRYKALGNSWAVPKFAWLGERIQRFMPPLSAATAANDNTPIKAAV